MTTLISSSSIVGFSQMFHSSIALKTYSIHRYPQNFPLGKINEAFIIDFSHFQDSKLKIQNRIVDPYWLQIDQHVRCGDQQGSRYRWFKLGGDRAVITQRTLMPKAVENTEVSHVVSTQDLSWLTSNNCHLEFLWKAVGTKGACDIFTPDVKHPFKASWASASHVPIKAVGNGNRYSSLI